MRGSVPPLYSLLLNGTPLRWRVTRVLAAGVTIDRPDLLVVGLVLDTYPLLVFCSVTDVKGRFLRSKYTMTSRV